MPTMSSLPLSIAWRAVATSWMRAAWKVGIRVAALTSPEKSRWGAEREPMPGMTCESASSVSIWPRMTLTKSMRPEAARRRAIETPSSRERPRSQSSSQTMRTPTMKSVADPLAHGGQDLEAEAHAVVERAAIVVFALVGGGRPELVDQVAVAFELEAIEAGGFDPLGAVGVGLDHPRDVPVLHDLGEGAVRGLAHVRGRDRPAASRPCSSSSAGRDASPGSSPPRRGRGRRRRVR